MPVIGITAFPSTCSAYYAGLIDKAFISVLSAVLYIIHIYRVVDNFEYEAIAFGKYLILQIGVNRFLRDIRRAGFRAMLKET